MEFMEISSLSQNSLRIKSKRAVFIVDPNLTKTSRSESNYQAAILLNSSLNQQNINNETVIINGPGEYEIGGIKMNAIRYENDIIYNPVVDGVDVILGKLSSLEKAQHKLKEQHIVIAYVDNIINASFITSLASNVVIFYGEKASVLAESFGQSNVIKMQKYTTTLEKLPQEVETVILE